MQKFSILHSKSVDRQRIDDCLTASDIVIDVESIDEMEERPPYASFEWILPATICILVAKPFLEGFFKKAGERAFDSMCNLIRGLFQAAENGREEIFSRHTILESNDPESFSVIRTYLQFLEIRVFNLSNDFKVRFVFPNFVKMEHLPMALETLGETIERIERETDFSERTYIYSPTDEIWISSRDWMFKIAEIRSQSRPS